MKVKQSGRRSAPKRSKVFEMVVKDLRERDQEGFQRFGGPIEDNPMDPLREAYEEALDMCVYLKLALYRREQGN